MATGWLLCSKNCSKQRGGALQASARTVNSNYMRGLNGGERELNDDEELDALFGIHIAALPETQRPRNRVQEGRMFHGWESDLRSELTDWKNEVAT